MSSKHLMKAGATDHIGVGRAPLGWDSAKNILAVRLDSLGDVLMTTPAIRALRETNPGRRVTLLTSESGAATAAMVPEINDVIVYEAPWMKASSDSVPGLDRAMIEQLRLRGFDAAVIFTVYSQNPLPAAMMCYLAEIPLRLAHCHENPYQLLTNWIPDPEPEQFIRHEARRQLDLVAAVGCHTSDPRLSLQVPESGRQGVARLLNSIGLDRLQPWAVIHAGATAASRRYPPEQFAQVAFQLMYEHGMQVVFTGSTSEQELVDQIFTLIRRSADLESERFLPRAYSLAGQLSLDKLAALLRVAPVLISNNTGPVHIAAALGTPVVVIYALTNPQHTPWMTPNRVLSHDDPADVPCKFCYKSTCIAGHHNCLRLIPSDTVVAATLELLSEASEEGQAQLTAPVGSGLARSTVASLEISA